MGNKKRRFLCYRSLKTISYLVGFPLLAIVVFATSMQFIGEQAFGFAAWYGVLAVLAVWLIATILQIVLSKVLKSDYKTQTLFVLIVMVVLVLVGAIIIDAVGTGVIKNIQKDYADKDVEIKDYTYQVNWFSTITSNKESLNEAYISNVDNFLKVYNIGFVADNYGDENTDLSKITYDKKDDAYYSPNGMYSDGFIFNIHQAIDILITYHETQQAYKADEKSADVELQKAIEALESNSNSAWNKYKQTEEYQKAYGEDGQAYRYMLTIDRLNKILSVLGRELEPFAPDLATLVGLAGMDEFASFFTHLNEDLTVEQIVDVINDLDLFDAPITESDLAEILKEFSFYQSPQARPIFEFIEDKQLREYGYAQYYATVHGAKVGSTLIGDNLGKVTMDFSGFPADHGYTLEELYELRADLSYKSTLYPLMAARRYMYLLAILVGASCILFYYFQNKEKAAFDDMVQGGK